MNTILQKRIEEASIDYTMSTKPMCIAGDAFADMARGLNKNHDFIAGANYILQNQWISVEEALPEKNTMCFVRKETEVGVIYDTDYIDYEGKWFFNFNRTSIKSMVITYWMPIPSLEGGNK